MKTQNPTMAVLNLAAAMAGLALTAPLANADIIQTPVTNGSQSFYDGNISASDLIDSASATLGGFTSSHAANIGPPDGSGVHNGIGTNNGGLAYWGSPGTVTLTYTLAGSATGYDITSINTIYGWGDSRERHAAQRYNVEITTVSNPTFTLLDSVEYDPYGDVNSNAGQASTQVTLTEDTTGVLASGVTGIRFTVSNDPGGNEVGVIREYDVFGSPSAAGAFAITAIDYAPDTNMVTLTWRSSPGSTYGVYWSIDMIDWSADLNDTVPADAGDTTSATFDLSLFELQDATDLFFRVERN